MAETKKSFLATLPGVVAGLAGVLTSVVGLLTLSVQQGWIGGSSKTPTTGATASTGPADSSSGGATGASGATTTPADSAPNVTITPTTLVFRTGLGQPNQTEQRVFARNTGTSAVTMGAATLNGRDVDKFSITTDDCSGRLQPEVTCTVAVRFTATALGDFTASLGLTVNGQKRSVALEGHKAL